MLFLCSSNEAFLHQHEEANEKRAERRLFSYIVNDTKIRECILSKTCDSVCGPMAEWNTSKVTDMSRLFSGCTIFNQNLSKWDTGSVTNMHGMFYKAAHFNKDIYKWNTANVTDMSFMFAGATKFNQNISAWDTREVTSVYAMFNGAVAFRQNISKFRVNECVLGNRNDCDSNAKCIDMGEGGFQCKCIAPFAGNGKTNCISCKSGKKFLPVEGAAVCANCANGKKPSHDRRSCENLKCNRLSIDSAEIYDFTKNELKCPATGEIGQKCIVKCKTGYSFMKGSMCEGVKDAACFVCEENNDSISASYKGFILCEDTVKKEKAQAEAAKAEAEARKAQAEAAKAQAEAAKAQAEAAKAQAEAKAAKEESDEKAKAEAEAKAAKAEEEAEAAKTEAEAKAKAASDAKAKLEAEAAKAEEKAKAAKAEAKAAKTEAEAKAKAAAEAKAAIERAKEESDEEAKAEAEAKAAKAEKEAIAAKTEAEAKAKAASEAKAEAKAMEEANEQVEEEERIREASESHNLKNRNSNQNNNNQGKHDTGTWSDKVPIIGLIIGMCVITLLCIVFILCPLCARKKVKKKKLDESNSRYTRHASDTIISRMKISRYAKRASDTIISRMKSSELTMKNPLSVNEANTVAAPVAVGVKERGDSKFDTDGSVSDSTDEKEKYVRHASDAKVF
eukprot:g2874.t1